MSLLSSLKKLGKFCCKFQFRASFSTQFEVQNINLNSHRVSYVKLGNGPKTILFFNGSLGSFQFDFKYQLEELDREKFTLIGWDLPGLGLSRPPNRQYHIDYLEDDADLALEFLEKLKVRKCSLVGWCDGGISSIILASKYPERVENLIIDAVDPRIPDHQIPLYERIRDIKNWSKLSRANGIKMYGEELLQQMHGQYIDVLMEIYKKRNGDFCTGHLKKVKCPTLICHGDRDPAIDLETSLNLFENISGSTLIRFKEGTHNLQIRLYEEFNKWITKFICHPEDITERQISVE